MPSVAPAPRDRYQEICKYFINGGCLRGRACPYSHELPDERHLDVNGLGFILNPNVQNAQKTVPSGAPSSAAGSPGPASAASPVGSGGYGTSSASGGGAVRQPFIPSPNFTTSSSSSNNNSNGGGGTAVKYYSAPQLPPPSHAQNSGGQPASSPLHAMPTAVLKTTPPPRYRPPEPYLEHNLTPVLVIPMKTSSREVAKVFTGSMLSSLPKPIAVDGGAGQQRFLS